MANWRDFLSRHWGDVASVVGLIATIIGFVATLIQVRKSRTAAQAAREAVRQMRDRMDRIDTAAECSQAISIMDEIKRLQRVEAWVHLPDRYSALRKMLMSIRANNPWLTTAQQAVLLGAIEQFRSLEAVVEKVSASTEAGTAARLNRLASVQIDKVNEVMIEIKREGLERHG